MIILKSRFDYKYYFCRSCALCKLSAISAGTYGYILYTCLLYNNISIDCLFPAALQKGVKAKQWLSLSLGKLLNDQSFEILQVASHSCMQFSDMYFLSTMPLSFYFKEIDVCFSEGQKQWSMFPLLKCNR